MLKQLQLVQDEAVPRHFFVYPDETHSKPWQAFLQMSRTWQAVAASLVIGLGLLGSLAIAGLRVSATDGTLTISLAKMRAAPAVPVQVQQADTRDLEEKILRIARERSRSEILEVLRTLRGETARSNAALSRQQQAILGRALDNVEARMCQLVAASAASLEDRTNQSIQELYIVSSSMPRLKRWWYPPPSAFMIVVDQRLGVETLRPWDLDVDPYGLSVLKPFTSIEQLESGVGSMFSRVDPQLAAHYEIMRREQLLDLDNRKGKAPGGYCTEYAVAHRPFIFMNAVGIHDDVQTLVHEGGHAFHVFESAPCLIFSSTKSAWSSARWPLWEWSFWPHLTWRPKPLTAQQMINCSGNRFMPN